MKGQWIGTVEGENPGLVMLDIDRRNESYCGYGVLSEHRPAPVSFAQFETADASAKQDFTVPVVAVHPVTGLQMSHDEVLSCFPELGDFSKTVTIHLEEAGQNLVVEFTTDIGVKGKGVLAPSQAARASEYAPDEAIGTWADFKAYAFSLAPDRYIFRGQPIRERLRTSFHRLDRSDLMRFINDDVPRLHQVLSARTRHLFNLYDPFQYGAFINLLQHHGYPTPLLDWTYSPFVAAFFAFRFKRGRLNAEDKKVRIFQLDKQEWLKVQPPRQRIAPLPPHLSVFEAIPIENPRAVPQQGVLTISNVDDIETWIRTLEARDGKTYLRVFDLPASEYRTALSDLTLMGITAGSLFPGIEGTCEEWRCRNFGYGI